MTTIARKLEPGHYERPTPTEASSATDTAGVIALPPLIYLGALGIASVSTP